MSKALINTALGGVAVAGAIAIAVANGLFDGDDPRPVAQGSAGGSDVDAAQPSDPGDPGESDAQAAGAASDVPASQGAQTGKESVAAEGATPSTQDALQAADDSGVATEGTSAASPNSAATGGTGPVLPRFDTVRAEPGGSTLIAGAGEPGAQVEVLVGGQPATQTQIGGDGKFVAFVDLPDQGEASVLTLRTQADGSSQLSASEVIVIPATVPQDFAATTSEAQEGTAAPVVRSADAPQEGDVPTEDRMISGMETAAMVSTGAEDAVALRAGAMQANPVAAPSPDRAASAVPRPNAAAAPLAPDAPGDSAAPAGRAGFSAPNVQGATTGSGASGADAVARADLADRADRVPEVGTNTSASPIIDSAEPTGMAGDTVAALTEPRAPDAPGSDGAAMANPASDPQIATRADPAATVAPQPAQAPTVLVAGPSGVEALQTAPLSPGDVALDSIGYDASGEVHIAGRGAEAAFVRVYLDNAPIISSAIRDDGRWRVQLPEVDTGTYTLRVDQVDAGGQVIARVESPFLREDPAVLANLAGDGGPISEITVQPGHTLWAISEDRYGHGLEYVKIFRANRDRIRNADLIYPGQIFDLPGGDRDQATAGDAAPATE